jgi:hypothetical protein
MACLADIPDDHLAVHVGKYGKFGIAITKASAMKQGARPVLYVPFGTDTGVFAVRPTIEEEWDEIVPVVEANIMRWSGAQLGSASEDEHERISDWLEFGLLAYVKFFNPTLAEDDPDNYYMEREWRATTHVPFEFDDISAVYVPDGWQAVTRETFPSLDGRVVGL